MALNFEKLGHKRCIPPLECYVKESAVKHLDFDRTPMKFFEGQYIMRPMVSKCLIEKNAPFQSYSLLKNFRHANVVTVENMYDECGSPRFVISWVDGSLVAWIKLVGPRTMFKSRMKGSAPTGALRQIILDYCSGLESLLKEHLYPPKIELQDMYVRRLGHKGIPQLYINAVEKLQGPDPTRQGELWDGIKIALKELYKHAPLGHIDPIAERFINYIGVTDVRRLQSYPDVFWDHKRKARYLLSIMSDDISIVLPKLQGVGISWPNISDVRLRSPFQEVLEHEVKTRGAIYDKTSPYDYLRLCKNAIKHWDTMPVSVKAHCDTWEIFIEKMERWNPLIWYYIYEATA